ncbi:hypothetical protein MLD38_018354 [Melastoma candidum]|uniref:Uncharacterized protein n=1 Tax=Melastoma candidum TaxID=119954 RepID=A0ACB9QUV7_9MYRT|nr:hypothetical protein MLD38_018354 [Melastoma candidum]
MKLHRLLLPSLYSPPILTLFLVLVLLLSPSPTSSAPGDAASFLREACQRASRGDPNLTYGFCLSSLAPGSEQASSIHDLVLVSIDHAVSNTTKIRSRIKTLLKGGVFAKDPYVEACLKDCLELYSGAKLDLQWAVRFLKEKDYGSANVELSAVMDASVTCEDGFGEREGKVSPLTAENRVFFQLSSICLALVTMLP